MYEENNNCKFGRNLNLVIINAKRKRRNNNGRGEN